MIHKSAALLFVAFASTMAFGHEGHEHASGFAAGLAHPLMGLDHLLAMLAVGIWAALWKGKAVFIAPALFIASMLIGALFALGGGTLPFVEHGIALSVLVLGLSVALVPAPSAIAKLVLPLIAASAIMHGYAHGAELPADASAAIYVAGFAITTTLLHAVGLVLGLQLNTSLMLRRATGLTIALIGSSITLVI
ncbi:MAG TPA: HupE/UreJ family protein [Burkholderiales bacterium]|nr:HupE/UreJ family protein [Burkholderiales bacterium]